jgi:hypothetical protein
MRSPEPVVMPMPLNAPVMTRLVLRFSGHLVVSLQSGEMDRFGTHDLLLSFVRQNVVVAGYGGAENDLVPVG